MANAQPNFDSLKDFFVGLGVPANGCLVQHGPYLYGTAGPLPKNFGTILGQTTDEEPIRFGHVVKHVTDPENARIVANDFQDSYQGSPAIRVMVIAKDSGGKVIEKGYCQRHLKTIIPDTLNGLSLVLMMDSQLQDWNAMDPHEWLGVVELTNYGTGAAKAKAKSPKVMTVSEIIDMATAPQMVSKAPAPPPPPPPPPAKPLPPQKDSQGVLVKVGQKLSWQGYPNMTVTLGQGDTIDIDGTTFLNIRCEGQNMFVEQALLTKVGA
jgi:hypothetical protein